MLQRVSGSSKLIRTALDLLTVIIKCSCCSVMRERATGCSSFITQELKFRSINSVLVDLVLAVSQPQIPKIARPGEVMT